MYLILGFTQRTSYTLAKFLLQQKFELVIVDQQNTLQQQKLIQELSQFGIVHNELGSQDSVLLKKYSVSKIFLSPGVPRKINLIQQAISQNIEILNDIEYFYRMFPDRTYIAITGTDGKTTVTTWLGFMLSQKKQVVLAGNIGNPIFEYADNFYKDHIFIIELSSFQLESLIKFHPYIAGITNINEDHLDRYDNMNEYASTKYQIFSNQKTSDFAIINNDDAYILKSLPLIKSHCDFFSVKQESDIYYKNDNIYYKNSVICSSNDLFVKGSHNIQNALFVVAIAKILKLDDETIQKGLKDFVGVPHRLEFVDNVRGIFFYNDSKATTLQAVSVALKAFEKPVILLAGGKSKGLDFSSISDIVAQYTKKVFTFGELGSEIATAWSHSDCTICTNLKTAVELAITNAQEGDYILLSPGGSSFDEFSSYEERGEYFKKLINNLK